MPVRLAYDVITRRLRARPPSAIPARLRVGRPAIDDALGGLPTGEVTLVTGGPAAAVRAFAHELGVGVALQGHAEGHAQGVLLVVPAAETVLDEMAHAWAGVRLGSASPAVTEMAELLSQLPIWLDDDPFDTLALLTDRVRRLLDDTPVPIRCVVIDVPSSMAESLDEVVHTLRTLAMAAQLALIAAAPGSGLGGYEGARLHLELLPHDGETRPRVERGPKAGELLALRWSREHRGFDELRDPDAEYVAEPFEE